MNRLKIKEIIFLAEENSEDDYNVNKLYSIYISGQQKNRLKII